jgi:hypothetical protein
MAFVRRRGNAWYLVHNVRRDGKVKQLHLARLGEHPRITDDIIRQVLNANPMLEVDWTRIREEAESKLQVSRPRPQFVQRLVRSLRTVNLDLADLYPNLLQWAVSPESANELITYLRMLRNTVESKLSQFEPTASRPVGAASSSVR